MGSNPTSSATSRRTSRSQSRPGIRAGFSIAPSSLLSAKSHACCTCSPVNAHTRRLRRAINFSRAREEGSYLAGYSIPEQSSLCSGFFCLRREISQPPAPLSLLFAKSHARLQILLRNDLFHNPFPKENTMDIRIFAEWASMMFLLFSLIVFLGIFPGEGSQPPTCLRRFFCHFFLCSDYRLRERQMQDIIDKSAVK